jgi:hypothetical protein
MHVVVGLFKYPSLMGIFLLPLPYPTVTITLVNMISSSTSGSLRSVDPCVVPRTKDVDSFGASLGGTLSTFLCKFSIIIIDQWFSPNSLYSIMNMFGFDCMKYK